MSKNEPTYFAILPAKIRYAKDLSSSQILMFAEITALSNKDGYCSASNNYFAKLYSVDPSTVSKWITGLKKGRYIRVEYEREKHRIKGRKITPLIDKGGIEINQGGIEKTARGVLKKDQGGIEKTAKYNKTSNNNTRNNNNAREASVVEKIEDSHTVEELVPIWRSYRKKNNKFDNIYTKQVQHMQFQQMGVRRVKSAMLHSIENGWSKLVEPESEDQNILDNHPLRSMN